MTKRTFKLPGIQDLSKEQEDARTLPKKGQHLIIGGPGTGKSVLALLRCRHYSLDNDNYFFLVYNHLLNQASLQLSGMTLISRQWQRWFMSTFSKMTGEQVPRKNSDQNKYPPIDWDGVLKIIDNSDPLPNEKIPFLVIDEGQDMPKQFYEALIRLGFENFYVVADQNQQIVSGENSSRQDIQVVLGIDRNNIIELQNNYRNGYPVARLAQEFYTGDRASPPPHLPEQGSSLMRPLLFEYNGNKRKSFEKVIVHILKMADINPTKLIGILTPKNCVRERYYDCLMKPVNVDLDNGRPRIVTYKTKSCPNLSFDEGGIMVINGQACKGLEFDIVFIADVDKYPYKPRFSDEKKKLFYVMTARAIERIIILKEAGKYCPIDEILPKDQNILERQ